MLTEEELATQTLTEVLEESSFGKLVSSEKITKGLEIKFECLMPGYTDWFWQVTISKPTPKAQPTVSEINLLAAEDSLVAPPWVPWAERLAEYRKARREQRESMKNEVEPEGDQSWVDVDENKMDEPVEIDLPELEPADADVEKSKDAKADSDDGGVKPPTKTTRAKRVKKTDDDNKDKKPNKGSKK
jgi:Protein of unknown function (DUF3027).